MTGKTQNTEESKQENQSLTTFKDLTTMRQFLASNYMKAINNYLGDEKKALMFLTHIVSEVERKPKLLQCKPVTLINSFLSCAQLKLMPNGVLGEAHIIPFNSKDGMEAQFQIGYQGWVTLLYRSGARKIVSECVYEKDNFECVNGAIDHTYNPLMKDRGKMVGAYAIITLSTGAELSKAMGLDEILEHAAKYSKSFNSSFSPWKSTGTSFEWMCKKTVLKQVAKLAPKNDELARAIELDAEDSNIDERRKIEEERHKTAKDSINSLKLGAIAVPEEDVTDQKNADQKEV